MSNLKKYLNNRGGAATASPYADALGGKKEPERRGLSYYIEKERTPTYADVLGENNGIYQKALSGSRVENDDRMTFGESANYLWRRLTGGAADSLRGITNDVGYSAQRGIPAQTAANAVAAYQAGAKTQESVNARREYEKMLSSYSPNERAAMEITGTLPTYEAFLENYVKEKTPAPERPVDAVDWGKRYNQETQEKYRDAGKVLTLAGDVAGGLGGMVPAMAARAVPVIGPFLSKAALFSSARGSAIEQALENGATWEDADDYGTAVGAVELGTEALFNGLGKIGKKITGSGLVSEIMEKQIKTKLANTPGAARAVSYLFNALGEGAEEYLAEWGGWLADKATIKQDERTAADVMDDAGYSFLVGSVLSGLMGAGTLLSTGQAETAQEAMRKAAEAMDAETTNVAQEAAQAENGIKKAAINVAEQGGQNENIFDAGRGNRDGGVGAGGPGGVFSAAAGEPDAFGRGDQRQNGRGLAAFESADIREATPAELGIVDGDQQSRVTIVDPERAGEAAADAADTVRSVGMEPVAFRGEMRIRDAVVNGYADDGKIYFRVDAVDSRGREITAEQIVEHELFHTAAAKDPELVETASEIVRDQMTETEFEAMFEDYKRAYSKVQDFSGWTAEQIAEYLYQEIAADAYAGLNYFNDAPETVEAVRTAAPQVGQAQTAENTTDARGPPTESENAPSEDGAGRAAISVDFANDFGKWIENGKPDERSLFVGTTSKPLQSVGIDSKKIFWDTSKINRIQRDHPEMSDEVLSQVPDILERPIIVMESITQPNRVTMFGEVYADNGLPVMAVLELLPSGKRGHEINAIKVANSYTKAKEGSPVTVKGTQKTIDESKILYIDPNKNRTNGWLSHNQLQLPFGITTFGPIAKVSLVQRDVKGNFTADSKTQVMPEWKKKLQEYDGRASVEVSGSQERLTHQERQLINEGEIQLKRNGKTVEVELREQELGWRFRIGTRKKPLAFVSDSNRTPQEAAREAIRIAEQYTLPEETRARDALNEAADEAIEMPPPVGRFSKAERDLEEDRLRTLVERDAPWGTGDVMREQDTEGQAAADEFADERAAAQAEESQAEKNREYRELLRGQMPVRDEEAAAKKIMTEIELEELNKLEKFKQNWRSAVRTLVNTGDTIHRIGRATGNKSLDGYYFRALAARQAGTEWIAGKRHDILGRSTGKGLNEIFNPIRGKGQDYYEQFQLYLFHMLNIDRMSRDYGAAAREAQAEVDRLLSVEPGLGRLSDTRLQEIANGYSLDAPLAEDYLNAVRKRNAAELKRPKPVFGFDVTAEDSRAAVDRLLEKHPEFEMLAQDVYDYSNDLLQYRVDAGMIQQKDKEFLQRTYPHYVPTFRATAEERAKILHKGGLSVSKAIGRATGSDETLLPLHVSLARQAMTVTKNGTINRLGNALLETRDANQEIMSQYILDVKEAETGFNEDTFDEEEITEPRKEDVITIIEDGKRYDLTLDEGLKEAFKAFEPDKKANKGIFRFTKSMVDLFKKLVTAYNPLFVVRNLLRDVQDAGLYSVDIAQWAKNYPKAYREILRGGKYWDMYKGLGGDYASFFDYAIGEVKEKSGLSGRIEMLNRMVEAAPRLAEFMTVVQKAEAGGTVTEADLMEAFEAAQDITTNFGRAGSVGGMLNKYFVPFLNPSIQGADKFIRTFTERSGAKAWAQLVVRAASLGIAPAVINALLHRGNDDWEEEWADISDATKANNYLFKVRDGVWLKIPRGRALAVLTTGAVAATEAIKGNDIDPAEMLEVIASNLAPQNPLEANIFKAWFDAELFKKDNPGQTWYGGQIENEYMQRFRPGERYDAGTDYISRWLGGALNLSPAKINYIIDQYSGVFGDVILPFITPESSAGLFHIGGVPMFPGVRRNFGVDTVSNNETTGKYYDMLDELEWDKNGGDIAAGETHRYMNHVNSAVSEYYAQIREIENDRELNNREKQELTRELRRGLIAYQKEILETVDKYRLAAEDYFDDHPEMDYEDPAAVRAYMEQYNEQQTTEEYRKDESQTAAMMKDIAYRELNREVLGAEYALETYSDSVYEKAVEANESAGVSFDTYYDYYFGTKDMHADRDENGKSISGTKKAKVLGFIADMDIPEEQKDALAVAAGYKAGAWKSYGGGKSGGGSGGGSGKKKKVTIRNTLTKPAGISYNRSMSIAARSGNFDTSAFEEIQEVTENLRKKNPWWALPTGNPELDEERPAAERYFATGEF